MSIKEKEPRQKMKIIDKQIQKYTKPEDFKVWDFIYDETSAKHYWIVANNRDDFSWKFSLICLETKMVVHQNDSIEYLLWAEFDNDPHLIKIDSNQVTMNFNRN